MRRMNKILALFVLSGGLLHAENLVFNGDFELGVCGFALERFQRNGLPDVRRCGLKILMRSAASSIPANSV